MTSLAGPTTLDRYDRLKLFQNTSPGATVRRPGEPRTDHWIGYRTSLHGPCELYDLETDPPEHSGRREMHPNVVAQIEGVTAEQPRAQSAGHSQSERRVPA